MSQLATNSSVPARYSPAKATRPKTTSSHKRKADAITEIDAEPFDIGRVEDITANNVMVIHLQTTIADLRS